MLIGFFQVGEVWPVSAENNGWSTDSVWPDLQLDRPKTSLTGQVDWSQLLSFLTKEPNPHLCLTGGGCAHFNASRGLIQIIICGRTSQILPFGGSPFTLAMVIGFYSSWGLHGDVN